MCSCETSFGSIFLFEIGASVDGAPVVRDAPLHDDNAAASCSDVKLRWRSWDGDYAMGYQRHP